MKKNILLRAALHIAMGITLATTLPLQMTHAASGDGSLAGRLTASDNHKLEGAEVTVRNPETGFTRTVKADADGYYRFPFLPVGKYVVEARRGSSTLGKVADVTIGLGSATTADVTLNALNVEEIQVVGTRIVQAVDVKSTESATNVTREELARLPVERDIMAAALLAPGLSKGDAGLCAGGNCGVSFGGSSIAENSIYINGLNVSDFYNRVGASAVPYAFYKEFQVKTGGYSVEFGRTTGGVINAVTRSGTNEFEFGSEIAWEPNSLQSPKKDHYDRDNEPLIIGQYDEWDSTTATVYASGPIVKDKLFFFAIYEARDYQPVNTSDAGDEFFDATEDNGFWGAKLDWQINDKNQLELLAFSDKNDRVTDNYEFSLENGSRGTYKNQQYLDNGGTNWALTYTTYLTDGLSAKALYGENERKFARNSRNDIECTRIREARTGIPSKDLGCTSSANITDRDDTREQARLDFDWELGAHQLHFGLDHETETSKHQQFYPGPDRLLYEVLRAGSSTLSNGTPIAIGTDYVRTRSNEVNGEFETVNSAYYLEDNWSITPSVVLNAGVRLEAFDNRNSDGDTYIKIDNMVAPRFGVSWDVRGDNRSKVFANAGRYFLPVANVINIKQAGGFLDARTYYAFDGYEPFEYQGITYQRPKLGAQLGPVDDSQGDGTVGDLRGEVDGDMDPVYQDEFILGFQGMIGDKWSWGVRGIYRKLNNAIDDMEITSNGTFCGGEPTSVGFVMANPGRPVTVFTDTNCDGDNDANVTIDTSKAGWAIFDADGNYVGERGWVKPNRTYKALEFVVDRAWDDRWTFNASYTLSFSKGNAEGPVNSDTNFADAGRTEAFDNPWVNLGGEGYLPNDHRHQFKFRGAYAFNKHWQVGAALTAQSGRPISAQGEVNPFDDTNFYSFYVYNETTGEYELHERGSEGTTPWVINVDTNVSFNYSFSAADLQVKFSVFNLFNQQSVTEVDEYLPSLPDGNVNYKIGSGYQAPRYAQLMLSLKF
ncbi:MAG TPA: TonB-dependent receptor [Steroidobacteraceae bacterium]